MANHPKKLLYPLRINKNYYQFLSEYHLNSYQKFLGLLLLRNGNVFEISLYNIESYIDIISCNKSIQMSKSPSSLHLKSAQRIFNRGPQQNKDSSFTPQMCPQILQLISKGFILNEQILKKPHQFFQANKTARNQIVQHLINMIEEVASISYHLLVEDKITDKEAKNYAAKNILQNTKQFCERISNKILDNNQTYIRKSQMKQEIQKKNNIKQARQEYFPKSNKFIAFQRPYKKPSVISSQGKIYQSAQMNSPRKAVVRLPFRRQAQSRPSQQHKMVNKLINGVLRFIIEELPVIMHQISLKYPIVPPSGYTSELKKNIKSIDIRQDYRFQNIYLANTARKLEGKSLLFEKSQSQKQNEDMSKSQSTPIKDIMEFLNFIILLPSTLVEANQTLYQAFTRFNKNLVWIISLPEISSQSLVQQQLLGYIAEPKYEKILAFQRRYFDGNLSVQQLVRRRQEDILHLDNKHRFEINNKLGKCASIFEKDEIDRQELTFKSSALLRILTKWIEDIDSTMKDSDRFIKDNGYSFTNKNNQLISLNKSQRSVIHKYIKIKWRQLEEQRQQNEKNIEQNDLFQHAESQQINNQQLVLDDYDFICQVLRQEWDKEIQCKFQNSLKLSNQINAYVGKITAQKLVRLFQILQSIPQDAGNEYYNKNASKRYDGKNSDNGEKLIEQQRDKIKSVSLICNRLGDLLRSKIYCTQTEFIKLLQLIYNLDSYCQKQNPKTFKLIRIKDKLKSQNNNVHINYMFYEKIQCELQICFVMSNKDKKLQKNNMMNHYFYQLKRGMFGVIPQLAIIINQNDPVYTLYSQAYQVFKKYSSSSKVKFYQQRTAPLQLLQASIMKMWRCCNRYCDYFSLDDSCKFIKQGRKFICLSCYKTRKGKQWHLLDFLQCLKYPKDKDWIPQFIKANKQKILSTLDRNIFVDETGRHQGVYMVIYPTNKKVFVQCVLIFYCNINQTLVIKSLESQNSKARQFKEADYISEEQNMARFYIKINKSNSLFWLLQTNRAISAYLKPMLMPSQLKKVRSKAIADLNNAFLQREIINKQTNLRLSDRQGLIKLQDVKINTKYDLSFVEMFVGKRMGLPKLIAYKYMKNLQRLSLKGNKITGTFNITNFVYLEKVQLNNNRIQGITISNTPVITQLYLTNNRISLIKYDMLQNLAILNLQQNQFLGELPLEQLKALKSLNINYNDITKLTVIDSAELTSINCKKKFQKRSHIDIILNEYVKLKELVAYHNFITSESLAIILANPQSLERLALEFRSQNFYLNRNQKQEEPKECIFDIDVNKFYNLTFFTFHASNFQLDCQKKKMEQFIQQLPKLKELQIHFKNCGVKKLDLLQTKNILSKLTLIQFGGRTPIQQVEKDNIQNGAIAENFQCVYELQEISLGKIQRLNLIANPQTVIFNQEWLRQLTVFDAQRLVWEGQASQSLKLQKLQLTNTRLIKSFQFCKCADIRRIYIHDTTKTKLGSRDNGVKFSNISGPYLRQLQLVVTPIDKNQDITINNCPQLQNIKIVGLQAECKSVQISPGLQEDNFVCNLTNLELRGLITQGDMKIKVPSKIKSITIANSAVKGTFSICKMDERDINLQELFIQQQVSNKLTKALGQVIKSAKIVKYCIFYTVQPQEQEIQIKQKQPNMKTEIKSSTFCNQISQFHLRYQQQFYDLDIVIDSELNILYLPFASFFGTKNFKINLKKVDSIIIREESQASFKNPKGQQDILQQQAQNDQNFAKPENSNYKIQFESSNKQACVIFQVRQQLQSKLKEMIKNDSQKYCRFEIFNPDNIADSQF